MTNAFSTALISRNPNASNTPSIFIVIFRLSFVLAKCNFAESYDGAEYLRCPVLACPDWSKALVCLIWQLRVQHLLIAPTTQYHLTNKTICFSDEALETFSEMLFETNNLYLKSVNIESPFGENDCYFSSKKRTANNGLLEALLEANATRTVMQ